MKFYIILLDDDGKLYVSNNEFDTYSEAKKFSVGICSSRNPRVVTDEIPAELNK